MLHYTPWQQAYETQGLEGYIVAITQDFLQPGNDLSQLLMSLEALEKQVKAHTQPQLAPLFSELFAIIRDTRLLPMIQNKGFNLDFFRILSLLPDNSTLSATTQTQNIQRQLEQQYRQSQGMDAFVVASILYLLDYFTGIPKEQARTQYVHRFGAINTHAVIAKNSDLQWFGRICHNLFADVDDALAVFDNALYAKDFAKMDLMAQKASVLWVTSILWNIYGQETNFLATYERYKELFYQAIKKNKTELAFFMHFPLSHIYLNLTHTQDQWQKFNDEVEKPLSEFVVRLSKKDKELAPVKRQYDPEKRPLKVAFVYDRIVMNSPFKVLYSLLKGLQEQNSEGHYEYAVYDLEYVEKSASDPECIKMITDLGIPYTSNHNLIKDSRYGLYYSHFDKCKALRRKIIADEIDVLIMCNNREQFNFLFGTRTAPRQLYWSHGSAIYDVNGIDKRISHILLDRWGHTFENFTVPMDAETFYNPPRDPDAIARERAKYPKDVFILGTIGRLIKLESDEYLETVAEIMKQHPHTIYIAAGAGGSDYIRNKVKELGISDRFYFPGFVDPHIYGHIIDLWLDTFPLQQGESRSEYASKGHGVTLAMLQHEALIDRKNRIKAWLVANRESVTKVVLACGVDVDYIEKLWIEKQSKYIAVDVRDYICKCTTLLKDYIKCQTEFSESVSVHNKLKHMSAKLSTVEFFSKL
ncbi:hypothetical protein [Desulfurispira natronophila]|uniref:Glycosyltransferase involved in cell wall biosynthesis n=1 Tax=Desulfurispira natronophila TaxID=682562 RepID=A0A7W7Y530_9BACT|nr:hypothetical protein [Desulfurispira natronophila]MBB5021957.1 glycosyltransferase involved in cell wall biosynthesis [Desulfurispira natronophila]